MQRARTTNAESTPLLDTNPPRSGEAHTAIYPLVKMKVQSIEPGGNSNLVLARRWNGQTLGTVDIPVEVPYMLDVGQVFHAFRPEGGTLELHNTKPVVWRMMFVMPQGQYQHQLWAMVANLEAGWMLPLAVPDRNEVET